MVYTIRDVGMHAGSATVSRDAEALRSGARNAAMHGANSAPQVELWRTLLGCRQATTRIQHPLSSRPDVERLNLDEVLADRSIEGALNDIWGVRSVRHWSRRLPDYLAVLIVAPLLLGVALSLAGTFSSDWLRERLDPRMRV